jgi:hypothetical protein
VDVVAHRLINIFKKDVYELEVLVYRKGKMFGKHIVVRAVFGKIVYAKVVGSVNSAEIQVLLEYNNLSSKDTVIYPNFDIPLGLPNSYYRNDNIEPLFIPRDPEGYVLDFLTRNNKFTPTFVRT